ncbi:Ig-like domain-containing protein, partial [Acinetobacter ursingii]|uniref:Ig-like domain-containing protein n=2 Tax=Acinetobacter ursingii TaxID=108980 RepID=UPI00148F0447
MEGQKDNLTLSEPSVVLLQVDIKDVSRIEKDGRNVKVTLKTGEVILISDFFDSTGSGDSSKNTLVFENKDHTLSWINYIDNHGAVVEGVNYSYVDDIEIFLYHDNSASPWLWAALPAAGATVAIASNSDTKDHSSDDNVPTKPKLDQPTIDVSRNEDGSVLITGKTAPNVNVIITDPNGSTHIVTADKDGNYTYTVPKAPNLDGNYTVVANDGTSTSESNNKNLESGAPDAPTAKINDAGTEVTGKAERGSTVEIKDKDGNVIGTGKAGADGNYKITVSPPQTNGEDLTVSAKDEAGNVSPNTDIKAPDTTPPEAPTAKVNDAGNEVTGKTDPNAEVTIQDKNGNVIGRGTADAEGNYKITVSPNQTNGDDVYVTAKDESGNVSGRTPAPTPDTTAPEAPTAKVNDAGNEVTGKTEPNAEVTVQDKNGNVIGRGTADAEGNYKITVSPSQTNGDDVYVTAKDESGNVSGRTPAPTPDTTAPDAPTAKVNDAGTEVTGKAERGSTVEIKDQDGNVIGTAEVGEDGNYVVELSPAQNSGEDLTVNATDKAGNVSPDVSVSTPDTTAPDAPTAVLNEDGSQITGTGEPGSSIEVKDQDGNVIGTAEVGEDGNYVVELSPAQNSGEDLTVNATDKAGNVSPDVSVSTPDTTAPDAPTAVLNEDGSQITGTGEPGSSIE